ncbi:MAG TPA: hypothetical protein VNJ09_03130 [Chthonomonadales bacterium]|nr:hypothetical protein [Chthonomonadales bacterium]
MNEWSEFKGSEVVDPAAEAYYREARQHFEEAGLRSAAREEEFHTQVEARARS